LRAAIASVGAARIAERFEQLHRLRVVGRVPFRMPLHAQVEAGCAGARERFDDAIVGARLGLQAWREVSGRQIGFQQIDVAADYGDAELRIATWLQAHPGEFFVATKTGKRTYREAREEIRRSLDRLGVDHVDSIQLHNLVDVIE